MIKKNHLIINLLINLIIFNSLILILINKQNNNKIKYHYLNLRINNNSKRIINKINPIKYKIKYKKIKIFKIINKRNKNINIRKVNIRNRFKKINFNNKINRMNN
jgi:hypothetical protein